MYRRTFDRLAEERREELLDLDGSRTIVDGHVGTWRMRVYHGLLLTERQLHSMGHFLVITAAEGSRALTSEEAIPAGSLDVRQPSAGDFYPGGVSRWSIATSVGTLFMPGSCRVSGMADDVYLGSTHIKPYTVPLERIPEVIELPAQIDLPGEEPFATQYASAV